jgi:hypothetical protein
VSDIHYALDPAGNITKIADTPAGGTPDTQCFSDDYLGRLTAAWTPASGDCTGPPSSAGLGGPAPYWQSWTLDATGNRRTQTDHAASGDATTTYTYPAAGSAQPHTLTATSTVDSTGTHTASYGYNVAGQTTSRPGGQGSQTLTWDQEGHLATLADSTGTEAYVYTPGGDRLISRDSGGTTLELGAVTLRLNKNTGAVTATRYYSFGGAVVAQRTGAGVSWLMSDHHGTDDIAIDAGTQNVTRRRFKPYGEARGTAVPWVNDKGYLHGTVDPSGLTHMGGGTARDALSASRPGVPAFPEFTVEFGSSMTEVGVGWGSASWLCDEHQPRCAFKE